MTDAVLVTGAFGLVGSSTVKRLAADGRRVIATDLDLPANRKAAEKLPAGVEVLYADLTDPIEVDALIASAAPAAIIHLAAIIPPFIFMRRDLAEKVNVGATGLLLAAAAGQSKPPRFVQASSIAVYGARNPHTHPDVLTADTPLNPADVYGAHKAAAEELVRASTLDWVILRLGGVLTVDPAPYMKLDNLYFEGLLPIDGRLQTVDVRDVARAFAAATTADAVGETLLIGGDDSHRLIQGDVAPAMAAAMGLVGGLPTGLKGNPASDADWFNTDWMDTSRAQELLGHQHHSWPEMLIETANKAGFRRHLLRVIAPLTREIFTRRAAYYGRTESYADPWGAITAKWADPPAVKTELTTSQKRALAIATVVAIAFGAYFLRVYFILIVMAAVAAYLFNPLFDRFQKRFSRGLSVALTLLAAVATVIVPLALLVLFAVVQISAMVRSVSSWVARTDLNALGDHTLRIVNEMLARIPFLQDDQVTPDLLRERMSTVAQHAGQYALQVVQGAAGGLVSGLTAAVLFVYVFISLLSKREQVQLLIRKLNPLGEDVTDLYLEKMGAMVHGTVFGQFVIALAQGVAGAASIYVAGFHDGFFIFAVLLSALAVIPLGSGVVSIPFGIGMILFGNVFGGIFVVAWHLLVVTNIDNVLRPILVPHQARLDSALMLLAVFAGISMFGFSGIILGPVLMIVIVTTISVYLAVYKGVPLDDLDEDADEPEKPGRLAQLVTRMRARVKTAGR